MYVLKIEENELLAALLTAQKVRVGSDSPYDPKVWREEYLATLREFIELNKGEIKDGDAH